MSRALGAGPVPLNQVAEEMMVSGSGRFDLKRRGEQYFVEQIATHSPQATEVQPSKMLWPILQSEVDNSGLQQNPGY